MSPNLYPRLYLWLAARRRAVLIITLLIAVVSAYVSSHIRLQEDILDTLPLNDPQVDDYRYALRKFRQIDRVYIDIGLNRDDTETLLRAADTVAAALETNTALDKVVHRVDDQDPNKSIDFLTGALPNLFTESDARALEHKLAPAEIRAFLTAMRRKLAGPEGMVLKTVVAADPIGSSALVVDKVLPLQTGFGAAHIERGRIVSADGRHTLILAEPGAPSSDSAASEALVADMLGLAREVEGQFPGVHVAITGGHRMSVDNATLIKTDATRCIAIGMTAMFALCWTAFRRRWLSLIAFLPSLFGTLVAGVVIAVGEPNLSAIATGFAVIAIGITVDYAVHLIYHLDDASGMGAPAIAQHLSRLVIPVGIGALTSAAAFAVMAGSPINGYRQLGIFGGIGVIVSAAFALLVMPLLVPVPQQTAQRSLWLTRWMERLHQGFTRHRLLLLPLLALLTVLTVPGLRYLSFEGDLARLNGITEATRSDDELIQGTWGDALGLTLVVARGESLEQALAENDRIARTLATHPAVQQVYSLASVCPSRATQEENIRRWQAFWSEDRRLALRATLTQEGQALGFRSDAFDPFWERLHTPPPLITLASFSGTPLEPMLDERVASDPNDHAISTLVRIDDSADVGAVREALQGDLLLDQTNLVNHITDLVKGGLGRVLLWTILLVAVILYLALGSVELLLVTLMPVTIGLLWTFGLMGWLGLPIDMMNSIFVIFIIGIGEDYSLFLVTSKLDEWRGQPPRMASTSASVLISALTTLFGFAVLAFANHPVLFSMGITVLIGMAFTLIATLVLTPLAMDLLLFRDPPRGAPRWWHVLGTLWVGLLLLVGQVILYAGLGPVLTLINPRQAKARLRRTTRWVARQMVAWMPFGKTVYQNISKETFAKPSIVISNHLSAVDVVLMVGMPGDVRQTPKKRVFDTPILGIGCKLLGHILVEPRNPAVTLQRCQDRLAEGASVHFYPEGTRSPDGYPRRFHRGAFHLAVQLRQDIIPIVFCDTHVAMPRDSYWFEPYHITIRALPRVTPDNFDYTQGSLALMRHCEALIRKSFQQQLDEINTPAVVRRKVCRLYRYQGKFVEQFVYWKLRTDPFFERLDRVVPRRAMVLDLGCGYGLATHWLSCFTDQRSFVGLDYDADKIRVARRTAPHSTRIRFDHANILEEDFPECDVVLLLDVLHYWSADKQERILKKARRALRPGGRLVLRDGALAENDAHRRVHFWERVATTLGHNQTREGLHFQTLSQLETLLEKAGFEHPELTSGGGRDSNVMFVATVGQSG